MTTFPALVPSSRVFTPGEYPATAFSAFSGVQNRVRHSNVLIVAQLQLSFIGLPEADMLAIWQHYAGRRGSFRSFDLPAEVVSFGSITDYVPGVYLWRYAGPGVVEDLPCGGHNVTLTLETVPPVASNVVGADLRMTLSLAAGAGAAGSYAPGITLSITLSISTGAAAIAQNGVSSTIALSLAAGAADGGSSDPNFSSVSLLLHMDGSNGSTTFTDSSSNALTVTANGSAQISTAEAKWGTGALRTTRSAGQLTLPSTALLELTGDFTIEFWVYAVQDRGRLVDLAGWPSTFEINQNSTAEVGNNAYKIYIRNADVELFDNVAIGLANQVWRHVALTRSGTDLRLFGGGTLYGTRTHSSTLTVSGVAGRAAGLDYFDGYIDDFRVTKGVARYTANFTAPTAPFPNS